MDPVEDIAAAMEFEPEMADDIEEMEAGIFRDEPFDLTEYVR